MPTEITVNGSDDNVLEQVSTDAGYPVSVIGSTRNRIEQVATDAGAGQVPAFSDRNAIEWLASMIGGVWLKFMAFAGMGAPVISEDGRTVSAVITEAVPAASLVQHGVAPQDDGAGNSMVLDASVAGDVVFTLDSLPGAQMQAGGTSGVVQNYRIIFQPYFVAAEEFAPFQLRQLRDGGYDVANFGSTLWAPEIALPHEVGAITELMPVAPGEVRIAFDGVGLAELYLDGVKIGERAYAPGLVAIVMEIDEYAEVELTGVEDTVQVTVTHSLPIDYAVLPF